jgi:hypothetical protein
MILNEISAFVLRASEKLAVIGIFCVVLSPPSNKLTVSVPVEPLYTALA